MLLTIFLKNPHPVVEVMFVLMVLLFILIVIESGVVLAMDLMGEKKVIQIKKIQIDLDDRPQINQNQIQKKIDKVEKDDDEAIAILTEDK